MIKGNKTEQEYRAVKLDSSSSLKVFSENRKKYYKKYIVNDPDLEEEEDSKAVTVGKLVETLLLEPEEFDNRFLISTVVEVPTGNMATFVEHLYKLTEKNTDEDGEITVNFVDLMQEAYTLTGFKRDKFDTVVEKFVGSNAEIYYKEIRQVRSKKMTVVTVEDVTNAENIVNELKNNPVTAPIVNLVNTDKIEVINQLQIENFVVNNHVFKGMLDKVVIDHVNKVIQPYDLKCTWTVENFQKEYYLYRRAYIQGYLYYNAVLQAYNHLVEEGYVVKPLAFIVCDSTNYMSPLIYNMTSKSLLEAANGFEINGRDYPGVINLIDELKWCVENDIWRISKENHKNNGIINL